MQPGGVRYRDWLGLVQNHPDKGTQPAAVVSRFRRSGPSDLKEIFGSVSVPLWSFGYDMDKAKARCYYEGVMPIPLIPEEIRDEYDSLISRCLLIADQILLFTKDAIRKAWYRSPKDAPSGDMTYIDLRFWQETEIQFYQLLNDASESELSLQKSDSLKIKWHNFLQKEGIRLFDEYSQYDQIGFADPKRIATARRYLLNATSQRQKKIKNLLMLSGVAEDKTGLEIIKT